MIFHTKWEFWKGGEKGGKISPMLVGIFLWPIVAKNSVFYRKNHDFYTSSGEIHTYEFPPLYIFFQIMYFLSSSDPETKKIIFLTHSRNFLCKIWDIHAFLGPKSRFWAISEIRKSNRNSLFTQKTELRLNFYFAESLRRF